MQLSEFISKLKLAHDVPNYYNNHFPYNCGYYDGTRFSFDCWNLIKAILGGWTDNRTKGYYVSPKDFPTGDCDGYHLLMQCTNRSKDFSKLKQAGTYLYLSTSPHAGVYVGDFQYQGETFNVVECTGAWASKVQYTYVDEKGGRYLYKNGPKNKYSWTDYGLLPWVNYDSTPEPLPTPNPVLETQFGIDVSRYQKGFNLKNAKNEGFTYVIAKAGGADAGYYKDSAFDDFCNQASMDETFRLGAYYFGNAFSCEDAVREASYFIQYLQGKNIKHVYYDVEGKMLNQGYTHLTDIINAFCQTMVNNGYICGVYSSESQFNSRFDDKKLSAFPHWIAKYSKNQPYLKSGVPVEMWQYGGSTNYIRSPKIAGTTVDQDFIYIPWAKETALEVKPIIIEIPEKKSIDQLAVEVLAGLWGNGIVRKGKLIAAGYDYSTVQKRVNEIVTQRVEKKKPHIVAKGETLSSIAKRYNTTVDALVKLNGIPNKNKIYVGQEIIIG